jgi:hypothetical protein
MNDIQKELASLKGEQEQHAKDSSQYSGLERTYEGLLTAVKTLEVVTLLITHCSYSSYNSALNIAHTAQSKTLCIARFAYRNGGCCKAASQCRYWHAE